MGKLFPTRTIKLVIKLIFSTKRLCDANIPLRHMYYRLKLITETSIAWDTNLDKIKNRISPSNRNVNEQTRGDIHFLIDDKGLEQIGNVAGLFS